MREIYYKNVPRIQQAIYCRGFNEMVYNTVAPHDKALGMTLDILTSFARCNLFLLKDSGLPILSKSFQGLTLIIAN